MPTSELQRLGRLHAADDADQRREHAHGRAGRVLEGGVGREDAGIAGRRRPRGCRRPRSGRRSRSPRPATSGRPWRDAGGVDRLAGGEVVAAVDDDVGARRPARSSRRAGDALDQRRHHDPRVDAADAQRRRDRLRLAERRQVVGDLPLQVGEVDPVVVDQGDAADAGGAEEERDRRAEAAGADHQRVRARACAAGPRCRCRRAAGGASSAAGRRRSWPEPEHKRERPCGRTGVRGGAMPTSLSWSSPRPCARPRSC